MMFLYRQQKDRVRYESSILHKSREPERVIAAFLTSLNVSMAGLNFFSKCTKPFRRKKIF